MSAERRAVLDAGSIDDRTLGRDKIEIRPKPVLPRLAQRIDLGHMGEHRLLGEA